LDACVWQKDKVGSRSWSWEDEFSMASKRLIHANVNFWTNASQSVIIRAHLLGCERLHLMKIKLKEERPHKELTHYSFPTLSEGNS
jgi:hypothetical protein